MLLLLAVVQAACLALLLLRLWPGRTRLPPVAPRVDASNAGAASIVVATLDEARRIGPCLEGLIAQGPVVREMLFIDSGSTDGTADLILAAARRDPRIRLLRDDPLPPGWVGTVWALQHGLQHASAAWVLGVDADTVPHAGLAGGALRAAQEYRYDAVSFAPRFSVTTPAVRWLQPAQLATLNYRFGATGTNVDGERVMANGQCFLARRSALLSAGGYSSARASFSDDVTLARHLARAGNRVGFLDGSRLYDVLSYASARETWREWGRSLDLSDSTSTVRQWGDVLFLLVVQGTPVPVLVVLGIAAWMRGAAFVSAAAPLAASSAAFLTVRVLLQFALRPSYERRGPAFWLSPLADPLAALRILLSTIRRPTQWRGRSYGEAGVVN